MKGPRPSCHIIGGGCKGATRPLTVVLVVHDIHFPALCTAAASHLVLAKKRDASGGGCGMEQRGGKSIVTDLLAFLMTLAALKPAFIIRQIRGASADEPESCCTLPTPALSIPLRPPKSSWSSGLACSRNEKQSQRHVTSRSVSTYTDSLFLQALEQTAT